MTKKSSKTTTTPTPTPPPASLRHLLFACEIIFKVKDIDMPNGVRLNSLVLTDKDVITRTIIGRAQQAAQSLLMQKLGEEAAMVEGIIDVVVIGVTDCGRMTEAEFVATPDGTKIQEQIKKNEGAALTLVSNELVIPQ